MIKRLACLLVVGFILAGCGYKTTFLLGEAASQQWKQIDVLLSERYTQVRDLLSGLPGESLPENIREQISSDIQNYLQALHRHEKIELSQNLETAIAGILAREESKTTLGGLNQLARQKQSTLLAHQSSYNESIRELNSYIRGIPGKWWASIGGVKRGDYWEFVPYAD